MKRGDRVFFKTSEVLSSKTSEVFKKSTLLVYMRRSFFVLVVGFFLGTAVRSFFSVSLFLVMGCCMVVCVVVLFLWMLEYHPFALYLTLFCVAGILGVVRTEYAFETYEKVRVLQEGEGVLGEAMVAEESDVRENSTVLVLEFPKEKLRVRVQTNAYPTYAYGDLVKVMGIIHIPETFENELGRTFDYPGFLLKEGIHYELRNAVLSAEGRNDGIPFLVWLYALKQSWLVSIGGLLPEPSASLAGGIIVGAKQSLGDWWLNAFRNTGVVHIVVLSGFNLTIVSYAILALTGRFSRKVGLWLSILFILAFACMVGLGATVVRASCMAVLGLFALHIKRPQTLTRLLFLAGFFMVLWNPFVLLFDIGFQLSFLATLGLIHIAPIFEILFSRIPETLGMRTILSATLATELAVSPLLVFYMGFVSLVAPLVNVLVLPVIPYAMGVGFFAGLLGMVSQNIAFPFAFLTYGILSYVLAIVAFFQSLPFVSVALPPIPFPVVAFLSGLLWWGIVMWKKSVL